MLGRLEGKLCVHSRPKLDKWRGSSNKVKAAIFDSNENIDELERKALDLLVNICPNPHPWPRALGSDQNNQTADTKSFLCGVPGVSLSYTVWSSFERG